MVQQKQTGSEAEVMRAVPEGDRLGALVYCLAEHGVRIACEELVLAERLARGGNLCPEFYSARGTTIQTGTIASLQTHKRSMPIDSFIE